MSGSTIGKMFCVTTWGESHGPALGAVIDGCPAGIELDEEYVQRLLDRRRPGQSRYSTQRGEADKVEILSGVFEGKTTGTPIAMMVRNTDQRSHDYSQIMDVYRPGHADYTFDMKYGFRDYRGGGRSSGRETIGRVMGGAVAMNLLEQLGIRVTAFTESVGPVKGQTYDEAVIERNPFRMADAQAAASAAEYVSAAAARGDSCGGVVKCVVKGAPAGLGDPVFDKLDADLAKAMMSIGAVKGVEIGAGFGASELTGTQDNDGFFSQDGQIGKRTNNAGGILGGISDGSDIVIRVAFKPTPSVSALQQTVTKEGENTEISIHGRHDPLIVARAVPVVEAMAAITICDALLRGMSSRMDNVSKIWSK